MKRFRGASVFWTLILIIVLITACSPTPPTPAQSAGEQKPTSLPAAVQPSPEKPKKDVLLLGTDISDIRTLDPHRQYEYSTPIIMHAVYETLITLDAGDYSTLKPLLAESWELSPDGTAWIFHLKPDVKFTTGNPLTAEDVKFSFERMKNLKDNPSSLADNLASVDVVDELTAKVNMVDKAQPLLYILTSPNFVVIDSKAAIANGGTNSATADKDDKATTWLDQQSAGTGPYMLTSWVRNSEVNLAKNPNYWRELAPFERVVIRHIADSAAQVLAIERGDVDAALNLTTEQLNGLASNPDVKIISGTSLDMIYFTLTSSAEFNEALAKKEARQAVAYAIDYDGIINGLMSGYATRPATFMPVGLGGSSEEYVKEFGYSENLDKAKQLLAAAGFPDGFEFDVYYANAAVAGTQYQLVAQKIQSDLARVGIKMNLKPTDLTTLMPKFRAGELPSVITFFAPDAMEPHLWATAAIGRITKRVQWADADIPQSLKDVVAKAGAEVDPAKRNEFFKSYMQALADQCNLIVPVQPIYRVATRTSITGYELTAAGWQVDLYTIKPAQ